MEIFSTSTLYLNTFHQCMCVIEYSCSLCYIDINKGTEVCTCVFQLLAVVSELHRQGLTVLVLGRKHMQSPSRSWKRQNMNLIQQKAHCFFTDNM